MSTTKNFSIRLEAEKFYLACVGYENKPLDEAYLVSLDSKSITDKGQNISWMKIGSGYNSDFRFLKRLTRFTYQCVDTKQEFTIENRGSWTIEAWNKFLNQER